MRMRWWGVSLLVGFLAAGSAGAGEATVASDRAAALVVFPGIIASRTVETVIQISNTSQDPVEVKCFYVNALGRCSVSGASCFESSDCPSPSLGDLCLDRWSETDFKLFLTEDQPLAWVASEGLQVEDDDLPLDGIFRRGPDGQSNAGTRVPPFGTDSPNLGGQAGIGEMKCYVLDEEGTPGERNVLKGELTLIAKSPPELVVEGGESAANGTFRPSGLISGSHSKLDVVKHNAIGLPAIEGANDHDRRLVLGGDGAEYNSCPNVLIMDHFFDGAENPRTGTLVHTFLLLVPCTENFLSQKPTQVTAQYLVFNEFEQRFSTSSPVECFFLSQLSEIDTSNPSRSVFSAGVAGTLTGQSRIRGVTGGLLGVVFEEHGSQTASFNLHLQGEREDSDVVTVVPH